MHQTTSLCVWQLLLQQHPAAPTLTMQAAMSVCAATLRSWLFAFRQHLFSQQLWLVPPGCTMQLCADTSVHVAMLTDMYPTPAWYRFSTKYIASCSLCRNAGMLQTPSQLHSYICMLQLMVFCHSDLHASVMHLSLMTLQACRIAKLFAKHMKVAEQQQHLQEHPVCIAAGTPNRLCKLADIEALKLSSLQLIVLDVHQDAKKRSE